MELEPLADNSLFEEGELSNGAGSYLFTGTTATGNRRRALIRFDFSRIPNNAEVTSATLTIAVSRTIASTVTVRAHRVTTDWGEGDSVAPGQEGAGAAASAGDATWTQAVTGDRAWSNPGGDFIPSPSASVRLREVGPYVIGSAELTADVAGWLDGRLENYGWIFVSNEGTGFTTAKRFNSREHPDGSSRPRLTVTYTTVASPDPQPVPLSAGWLLALAALLPLVSAKATRN